LSAIYFLLPPRFAWAVENPAERAEVAVFIAIGCVVSVLSGLLRTVRKARNELATANRRKHEFLTMLAHELRTPLGAIQNALAILERDTAGGAASTQPREIIERQTAQIVRIVDDLLDVTRIGQGKLQLQKEPIELQTVVARATETVHPMIEARHQALAVSLPPVPLQLEADPSRLTQVLVNLLVNAAKYTNERGHIWLTCERVDGAAVVRVRDDGIGIAPAILPHLFDLYTQAERALDRSQGGLGIGLALARSLVEMHNGQIEASSAGPGKGSEFVVCLPALPAVAERPESPRSSLIPAAVAPMACVLIVDDSVDVAESLAMLMQGLAQEIRLAHSGPQALAMARERCPNVILCDIGMPGMDGYELARRLRQEPGLEKVFLAAVSGYGHEEDQRRSQEAGFDRHLLKPIGRATLESLLASVDEKKEATV
jgi:two-component system CheB/CheR fusion protein